MIRGFDDHLRTLERNVAAEKKNLQRPAGIAGFFFRPEQLFVGAERHHANVTPGHAVGSNEKLSVRLRVGKQRIDAAEQLSLPRKQPGRSAGLRGEFSPLEHLLVVCADQRVEYQRQPAPRAPAPRGGDIALSETGHPYQIDRRANAPGRFQIAERGDSRPEI